MAWTAKGTSPLSVMHDGRQPMARITASTRVSSIVRCRKRYRPRSWHSLRGSSCIIR